MQPDLSTDDNGSVNAFTSQQSGDVLLLATIDTTNDTTTLHNREPDGSFNEVHLSDDKVLLFGENSDYSVYYDSSGDVLSIDDQNDNTLIEVADASTTFENSVNLSGNAINDVSSIDGGGDKVDFTDNIDLTDQTIDYDDEAGAQNLVDMGVGGATVAGTEHSYDFRLGGTELLQVYSESDGAGSTQNTSVDVFATLDLNSNDLIDDTQTIWDTSAQEVPDSALGSIDNATLSNDSITLNAGDGLKNGSTAALGESFSLDIEPADFAGSGLTDDGSDNLELSDNSVTVTAGTDLGGGGSVSLGGSITINHADTSTQGNVSAGAGSAITDIDLDGSGHVTSIGTTSFDSRYDNYGSWNFEDEDNNASTVSSGQTARVSGGGGISTNLTSTGGTSIVEVSHLDTSTQGDVTTSGATVIDDIDIDGYGHVDNINTENRTIDDWQNSGNSNNNNVDADTVDGQDASDLGKKQTFGGTLDSHKLNAGEYVSMVRIHVPSGKDTLKLYTVGVSDNNFNVPNGLNLIVRNQTENVNEATFNSTYSDGDPLTTINNVSSDHIAIVVDNGNFGGGTGSTQIANGHFKAILE